MLEVISAFVGSEGIEKIANACPEVFDGALGGLSEQGLELGEGELDGIEVRGVRWQEEKPRAARFDEPADLVPLVAAQIVELILQAS